MRRWIMVGLVALTVTLGACGPSTQVPADAVLFHVAADAEEVRLDPASVPAGDVYLALDEPTTAIHFVQRRRTKVEAPGPMTDDDLARLAQGDLQGTSMEIFDLTGCDAAQRAAERGRLRVPGGCGNVFRMTLVLGKYALVGGDVEVAPGQQPTMGVLQVTP